MHTAVAPQGAPHPPQFVGSFCMSTHAPLHSVSGKAHVVTTSGPVSAGPPPVSVVFASEAAPESTLPMSEAGASIAPVSATIPV